MKNVHHVIWYSKLKSRKKQHEGSLNDHSGNSKTDSDSASNKGYQQHLAVTLVKRHQLSLSYSLSAITLYSHFTVLRYSFNNMHMISYLKTSHSKDFCRISQWLRLAGTSGGHFVPSDWVYRLSSVKGCYKLQTRCMFFINPRLCLQSESDAFENRLKGNMCMTVKNMSHLVLVLQMIWCLRNQKDDSLFSCGRN